MFESLSEKLNTTFKRLTGRGRLSEENIRAALKEVRLALLEADVNYRIVKKLTEEIRQRAIGVDVLESLTPGQQVIKIVNEELTRLMGETRADLQLVYGCLYGKRNTGVRFGDGRGMLLAPCCQVLLRRFRQLRGKPMTRRYPAWIPVLFAVTRLAIVLFAIFAGSVRQALRAASGVPGCPYW